MALFRGIQEYIALDANNITLVFDSGNIVNISGNIFLYPPQLQGHPILYNYLHKPSNRSKLVFVCMGATDTLYQKLGKTNCKTLVLFVVVVVVVVVACMCGFVYHIIRCLALDGVLYVYSGCLSLSPGYQ